MKSGMSETQRRYLEYLLIVVVIIGFFLVYTHFMKQELQTEMHSGFTQLEQLVLDQSDALETTLLAVNSSLYLENKEQDAILAIIQKDAVTNFNFLENLVEDLESQSQLGFNELKGDLAEVEAGAGDFSGIAKQVLPSVVSVLTNKGQGSGVFIDDEYIVTNYHVIEGITQLGIRTYDNEQVGGAIIGYDPVYDLAVIKVNLRGDALRFGDSGAIEVGENVIALGNPGGLSFTVTEGIISATERTVSNGLTYIQIDVPINPGNSGGPLVDKDGKIIGINNFKIGEFESIGFAIPSNVVEDITDQIIDQFENPVVE